jgi:6-phosphogluconolactonase
MAADSNRKVLSENMRIALVALVIALASSAFAADSYLAYIGTYSTGESKGIYAYRYDAKSGKMSSLGLAAETENPSFVAVSPNGHFLYAVNEVQKYQGQASGAVSAFSIDAKTGKLTFLNQVPSRGADPCFISFDKTGKFVLVANYTGGNAAVFPVQSDGRIGEATGFVQHSGRGPNHERQEGPHAHWIAVTPDNRFSVVADLGLDQLLVYHFDAAKGLLSPNDPPFAKVSPGSGPRHLAFHPDGRHAYVIDEMVGAVNTFALDSRKGTLQLLQTVSTLPANFSGENTTAEIEVHPNGRFVYASNRGHDSIVVYAIDAKTGTLKQIEDVPTQGKTPRNFRIDPTGTRLFVANQDSGNIVMFTINAKTGRLTASGEPVKVPNPVCIQFTATH